MLVSDSDESRLPFAEILTYISFIGFHFNSPLGSGALYMVYNFPQSAHQTCAEAKEAGSAFSLYFIWIAIIRCNFAKGSSLDSGGWTVSLFILWNQSGTLSL